MNGQAGCLQALLDAGANPHAKDSAGKTALHGAAGSESTACTAALLAAGARGSQDNWARVSPAHLAARSDRAPNLRLLLAAEPAAALCKDSRGCIPLQHALRSGRVDAARCLLELTPTQPARVLLADIEYHRLHSRRARGRSRRDLYALVAAHQPLTPAQWARIPTPCPGLGAALPAVLQRSSDELRLLMRRLPRADRKRLRTFALCLGRVQQRLPEQLPAQIVWRLLALSVAG